MSRRTTKRSSEPSERRRVQMDLPPRSVERLEWLKQFLEAVSYAEVIKDALRLLEYVCLENSKGKKLYLEDEKGNRQEIILF